MVIRRIISSLAYNRDEGSPFHAKEGRLSTTAAGPGGAPVKAWLNRDTFIYLCICALYAYVSGNRLVSQRVWFLDTYLRNCARAVELNRSI